MKAIIKLIYELCVCGCVECRIDVPDLIVTLSDKIKFSGQYLQDQLLLKDMHTCIAKAPRNLDKMIYIIWQVK